MHYFLKYYISTTLGNMRKESGQSYRERGEHYEKFCFFNLNSLELWGLEKFEKNV